MSDWHVGQHVVCIREIWGGYGSEARPSVGDICTIRGIKGYHTGEIGFVLEEVSNQPLRYSNGVGEAHFNSTAFRPVRTTDISIFTAMLAPTPRVNEPV